MSWINREAEDDVVAQEDSSTGWRSQKLISDPILIKSLREFRPMTLKLKQDTFLDCVSRRMQFNNLSKAEGGAEMVIAVVDERCTSNRQVDENERLDSAAVTLCSTSCLYTNDVGVGRSSDFPVASKEKKTRSIGTSTFKEYTMGKYSSEPSLTSAVISYSTLKRYGVGRNLRKSASLPSIRCVEHPPPPLAPIAATGQNSQTTVKPNGLAAIKPVEVKLTLINSSSPPLSYIQAKPRTTFVEVSHAEFMKRQMFLNDRVRLRHGFRLGGQIVCVPELVSCSAPHVDKAPPLILDTSSHLSRTRESKIASSSVVVCQTTSSHTIHYTPSSNHIPSVPSHVAADKCSVVYVRESAPPTPSAPTWQEQARMKPIIAYAKRKTETVSDASIAENMKVATLLNDTVTNKLVARMDSGHLDPPIAKDVEFSIKDEKPDPIVEPSKPMLPKFNQTFVQNFQVKPVEALPEPTLIPTEALPIDLNPKLTKKVTTAFHSVPIITTDSNVIPDAQVVTEASEIPLTSSGVIQSTPVIVQTKPVETTPQVGLLIYTQGSSDDSSAVPTLLLTTLPNGSAYCVRLPTASTASSSPQIDMPRPLVVQASLANTATLKPTLKTLPLTTPVESNKVALLKDLKEFENVFEETKLKFEKEKQLNVVDCEFPVKKGGLPSPQLLSLQSPGTPPKLIDCEKVVVGMKRKPECELPVLTRLYTTAKKPVIVVANYGQATTNPSPRPIVAQTCTTVSHIQKTSKGKSRNIKTYPNPSKSPPVTKPQQKPQEDEKTQQKIYAILEEYAVQKEHSPDTNNRPAPRRRSNPPSASASKKKRPIIKCKDGVVETEDSSFSEM